MSYFVCISGEKNIYSISLLLFVLLSQGSIFQQSKLFTAWPWQRTLYHGNIEEQLKQQIRETVT